jgi:hypothetical protein
MMRKMNSVVMIMCLVALSVPGWSATLSLKLKNNPTNTVIVNYNGHNVDAYAGTLSATLTGNDVPVGYPTSFDTYCIDLNHDIYVGYNSPTSYNVSLQPISDLTHGTQVAWLYDHYGTNTYNTKVQDSTQAAALQIAMWDVISDGGDGLNNGNFQYAASGDIHNYANAYLTAWNGQTSNDATWLNAQGDGQNMIGPAMQQNVPEPGVLAFLMSSLAGGGMILMKRRRC